MRLETRLLLGASPLNSHKLEARPIAPLARDDDGFLAIAAPVAAAEPDLVTFADVFVVINHHEGMPVSSSHDPVEIVAAAVTQAGEDFEKVDSIPVAADAAEPGVPAAVVSCACILIRTIIDSVALP